MGGAATLEAAVLSIDTSTNRRLAAMGGGGVADEMRPRRNAWGGLFSAVLGWRMGRPKREREGPGLGLKRPPLSEPMQQPTENSTSGAVAAAARWRCSARRRRQLGGVSGRSVAAHSATAAAAWRWRGGGGSLAVVAWRGQLGSGAAAAAERWRRSARRRRQLGRGRGTKINKQLKAPKRRR